MALKPGKKTPFDDKGNDNSVPVGPDGKWASINQGATVALNKTKKKKE